MNCFKLWKGVAPVLDLISPELPEDQPRAPKLTSVEKAHQAWGWLQQFIKDAGEFAGAHVLSMVRAHYPLIDLSRLERGYPNEVGPKEGDGLRVGLLDLSSTVIGDINLYRTSTPSDQPGSDRSAKELSGHRLKQMVLGILNANRKICKRTDTDVALTREYSRVLIFHRECECTN